VVHQFPGGSYEFLKQPGVRNLEGRVLFHYYATGITPAMAMKMVGVGSQYAAATTDSEGRPLDGSKTYKIHLPPASRPGTSGPSWSMTTRPARCCRPISSSRASAARRKGVVINDDGSVDVWFGPTAPKGHESNWVQTVPGKGWNSLLRLYGPEQAWFDKTWKPGDFELVEVASAAEPKYKADVPKSLITPDKVQTELLGELEFTDGMPSEATVKKTYDFIDLSRAVDAFLNGIPAASIYAMLEGLKQAGAEPGDLVLWEDLYDARSLLLTPQTTTPYAFAEINVKDEPAIVEVPAGRLVGAVDDAFFRWVTDLGLTGPNQGKGGKYVFVGPDYEGELPDGYRVVKTPTYRNWMFLRALVRTATWKRPRWA
jgi:hypothetical protein